MKTKKEFLKEAQTIRASLVQLENDLQSTTLEYLQNKNAACDKKELENIRNAKDWINESLRKLEIAIRNLENNKGYFQKIERNKDNEI